MEAVIKVFLFVGSGKWAVWFCKYFTVKVSFKPLLLYSERGLKLSQLAILTLSYFFTVARLYTPVGPSVGWLIGEPGSQ